MDLSQETNSLHVYGTLSVLEHLKNLPDLDDHSKFEKHMNELQNQTEIQFIDVHFKKVGDSFDPKAAYSQEPLAAPQSFQFLLLTAEVFDP